MVRRFWYPVAGLFQFGRPGGIRTPNIRFWRPALYQFELLAYCLCYRVSLCIVCLLQCGQNFLCSTRSGCKRLFFMVS